MVRTAAKAIIINEGKILTIKMQGENGVFYLLPGGGQEHGENLHENLKRECKEEAGVEVEVGELRFVRDYIEKHHKLDCERDFHQVEFLFECKLKSTADEARIGTVPDERQIGVEWIELDDIMDIPFYPLAIRPLLMRVPDRYAKLPVYLGDIN
ncbi:NUDIX domain-containing protein [Priestia abyssalis]|uniref:NUDIX domain-containing protein n=1 Tax=Priestia abyssalis TaxID=1221450 RepID=UPI000994E8B6|nr:NUDIX domain-containing protein [Priestia abyssalis]